jgi:hypothetical protein
MSQSPWFWIAIVPLLVESVALWLRPTMLARFARLPLSERAFTLRGRKRGEDPSAGYREPGRKASALPALPARTELAESVLCCAGETIVLRRAYGLGRRNIWLVAIAVEQAGDEVVMRAKQAFVPVTLPIFLIGVLAAMAHRSHLPWPMLLGMLFFFVVVVALQHLFTRGSRDAAISEAFDFLEGELRRELEEPMPDAFRRR